MIAPANDAHDSRAGSRHAKRFTILSFEEVLARPAPTWLVHHVLPSSGLALLYGASNVGKTFLALDLAFAVASGQPWLGQDTRPGDVAYIVAEGVAGFQKRLRAGAASRHLSNETTHRLHFIDTPVQLHSTVEVESLISSLTERLRSPIALIVVDTLARCFSGGEENSAKEVGTLIDGADRIRKHTGATVLLLHHMNRPGIVGDSNS